jgi:hypothetical protein
LNNKVETKYTVDYFIKKFTAIPDELWCVNHYRTSHGQRCASGWCGKTIHRTTVESLALNRLMGHFLNHTEGINDNFCDSYSHLGDTPKERILVALENIKGMNL